MWLTQPSPLFRKDLAIARFCANPVVAFTHLLLVCGIFVHLNLHPTTNLSALSWTGVAIVPGAWLFITAMLYLMLLSFKLIEAPVDTIFCGVENTWKSVLLRREALSLVAILALVQATVTWHEHQQFDQEDFHACVAGLQEPGLKRLARSITKPMTRQDFRAACWDAYSIPLTPDAKPATAEELSKQYGQP